MIGYCQLGLVTIGFRPRLSSCRRNGAGREIGVGTLDCLLHPTRAGYEAVDACVQDELGCRRPGRADDVCLLLEPEHPLLAVRILEVHSRRPGSERRSGREDTVMASVNPPREPVDAGATNDPGETPAPERRPYHPPSIIVRELRDTETGTAAGADGSTHS